MVHYVFWLFSGGAPASQPAKGGGEGGGFQSLPAAARRSSPGTKRGYERCNQLALQLRESNRMQSWSAAVRALVTTTTRVGRQQERSQMAMTCEDRKISVTSTKVSYTISYAIRYRERLHGIKMPWCAGSGHDNGRPVGHH